MRWIDLSEHGLSLWIDESRDNSFVLSSIRDESLPGYAVEFATNHQREVSGDARRAYLDTATVRDLLPSFPGARVRWTASKDAIERTGESLRANWLFVPQSPDPGALHLSPGFSLPEWVSVIALSENEAASLGSHVEAISSQCMTDLVPHPVLNDVFYGVNAQRFPGMVFELGDLVHNETAQDDDVQDTELDEPEDIEADEIQASTQEDATIRDDVNDGAASSALVDFAGIPDTAKSGAGRREDYGRVIPWARKHIFQLYSQDDENDTKAIVTRFRSVNLEFLWSKKEQKAILQSPYLLNIIAQDVIVGMMSPSAMDTLLLKKHAPIGRSMGMKYLKHTAPSVLATSCISHATAILQVRQFFEGNSTSASMVRRLAEGVFTDAINPNSLNDFSKILVFDFMKRGALDKNIAWGSDLMLPLVAPAGAGYLCMRGETDARENAVAVIPKNEDGTVNFESATREASTLRGVDSALFQVALFNLAKIYDSHVNQVFLLPSLIGKEVLDRAGVLLKSVDDPEKKEALNDKLSVTSRTIIRPFMKQMRVSGVPVLHGLHRGLAFQYGLRQMVIVECDIA